MALIIFTPFVDETRHIEDRWSGIPTIAFRKQDLTEFFQGLSYTEEQLESKTEYGAEHIFYLEKNGVLTVTEDEPVRPTRVARVGDYYGMCLLCVDDASISGAAAPSAASS